MISYTKSVKTPISIVLFAAVFSGCGKDRQKPQLTDGAGGESALSNGTGGSAKTTTRVTVGVEMATKRYQTCVDSSECGSDLECVSLLGSQVCSVVGCKNDGERCIFGETCVVSDQFAPDGVCAFVGTDQFCSRNCRDPLVCNLTPECATRSCCGLAKNGCPSQCEQMDRMECEISPQCPVSCCETM